MIRHYILEGHEPKAVDLITWAEWLERDPAASRVGNDYVGRVRVSTVFTGIVISENPAPRFFETMVFGGPMDRAQRRYVTWAEAVEGHAAMLASVREVRRTYVSSAAWALVFALVNYLSGSAIRETHLVASSVNYACATICAAVALRQILALARGK